jgi:hypothetical protein
MDVAGERQQVSLFVKSLPRSDALYIQAFPRKCTEAFLGEPQSGIPVHRVRAAGDLAGFAANNRCRLGCNALLVWDAGGGPERLAIDRRQETRLTGERYRRMAGVSDPDGDRRACRPRTRHPIDVGSGCRVG